jgi:hypothetical protein
MSPQLYGTYKDSQGIPTERDRYHHLARKGITEAINRNLPIAPDLRWTRMTQNCKETSGNHWVYVVGVEGDNLKNQDQQNGHILGTVNMNNWKGSPENDMFT